MFYVFRHVWAISCEQLATDKDDGSVVTTDTGVGSGVWRNARGGRMQVLRTTMDTKNNTFKDCHSLATVTLPPDVVEIILSDPRMWADTIRTITRQRARLDRQLVGRVKPIERDDVDCGVPHLIER